MPSEKLKPAARRIKILEYLKNHETISRSRLCEDLQISTSTLSEDINQLRLEGYHIVTSRKTRTVSLKNKAISESDLYSQYEPLNDQEILDCLLLYQMNDMEPALSTKNNLLKSIGHLLNRDNPIYFSDDVLSEKGAVQTSSNRRINFVNQYLKELGMSEMEIAEFPYYTIEKTLSSMKKSGIIKTVKYPHYDKLLHYLITEDSYILIKSYRDVCAQLLDLQFRSVEKIWEPLGALTNKLSLLTGVELSDVNGTVHVVGRKNSFDLQTLNQYQQFQMYPYKEKVLNFIYRTKKSVQEYNFMIGLVYYSTGTGQIYMIGINIPKNTVNSTPKIFDVSNQKKICLVLSNVDLSTVHVTTIKNEIYMDASCRLIFHEIFESGFESQAHKVEVRFQKLKSTEDKLKILYALRRETAEYCLADNGKEYIYTDHVRGLTSFARYLRNYGMAAIPVKPKQLVEIMSRSAKRTLKNYEKNRFQ